MLKTKINTLLRRFAGNTEGYVTVEVLIMLPVLFVLFSASWVYFDAFRQQAINQKANYSIADMISRETDVLDDAYFDNAFKLLGVLTRTPVAPNEVTGLYPSDMRITVVSYKENNNKYSVEWSVARGDVETLTTQDLDDYSDHLPVMMDAAEVVLVETWEDYNPTFSVGLDPMEIRTYSFTHPRYAPQVLYAGAEHQNNGWGNGDQDAPGNSLCNNNAENSTECDNPDGSNNREPKNPWQGGWHHWP